MALLTIDTIHGRREALAYMLDALEMAAIDEYEIGGVGHHNDPAEQALIDREKADAKRDLQRCRDNIFELLELIEKEI